MGNLRSQVSVYREGSKLKMPNRFTSSTSGPELEMRSEANGLRDSDPADDPISLGSSQLTVDEQEVFLVSLLSVMAAFVDLGFGVHAVQQAISPVGKDEFARLAVDFLRDAVQSNEPFERS